MELTHMLNISKKNFFFNNRKSLNCTTSVEADMRINSIKFVPCSPAWMPGTVYFASAATIWHLCESAPHSKLQTCSICRPIWAKVVQGEQEKVWNRCARLCKRLTALLCFRLSQTNLSALSVVSLGGGTNRNKAKGQFFECIFFSAN